MNSLLSIQQLSVNEVETILSRAQFLLSKILHGGQGQQ